VKTKNRNQLQGGKQSGSHYKKNTNINKAIVQPPIRQTFKLFVCVHVFDPLLT